MTRPHQIGCQAVVFAALAAWSGAAAAAQATPPVTAGWQEGFVIQSADGDFRLRLGLVAQADGRFIVDDDGDTFVDTFTIRKARPMFTGRIAGLVDFTVVPDFGGGTTVLQDTYFDLRVAPSFRVRAGKSKTPIGYEILVSDPFVLLPERSLASSLLPNRDVGVQVLGDLAGGRVSYAGGLFNGIPDGSSSSSDVDANGSKDFAGRIVVEPFRRAANPGPLNGLGVALAGSGGTQRGPLPSFRTSVGQRYFGYAPGVTADGSRTRVTPTVFFYRDALGVFGEYVRSAQDVAAGGLRTAVANRAWNVTASYVLTGEPGADRGVRPRATFDPGAGTWGALQLLARYARLTVDDAVFADALAAPGASRAARAFALGLNWYPAYFIKYYFAFEHTAFEGGVRADDPERSVIFRAQLAF